MRKKTAFLLTFLLLPGLVSAEEARLLAINGTVEARQAREGQWVSAAQNMEIAEGGAIRTGADGSAVALMPNKTKVWIKESTDLEIEQRQTLASRLALVFGSIKLRVPHLMRKEKFEVRTPAAVCAVRGTEFTIETTESGKMELNVLYGEVKLKFIVPPAKGASELYIPQGRNLSVEEKGKAGKLTLMNPKQERAALENWNPGLKPEERQRELKSKENDRAQVKEFARVTNNSEQTVKSFLNVVKESDLEAGRTLTDVHGNLVRVDQRMMRPDNNTIQFFNLVKRPSYADFTGNEFAYNGGAVSTRLDLMQMNMNFDKALPQRIEEWPSFFNSNSINPVYASFITANRTNKDEIFVIAEGVRYDAASDELVDDVRVVDPTGIATISSSNDKHTIITGILSDTTLGDGKAQEMLNAISRLEVKSTNLDSTGHSTNGLLSYRDTPTTWASMSGGATDMIWAMNMSPASGVSSWSSEGDPYLWQYQADAYAVGNKSLPPAGDIIFYARESYVINNGGQIQQTADFTESNLDPFTILKNSGAETITYIKKSRGSGNTWADKAALLADIDNTPTGDRFQYSAAHSSKYPNIDVVFIPDLFLAAVQRMLPAITEMGN